MSDAKRAELKRRNPWKHVNAFTDRHGKPQAYFRYKTLSVSMKDCLPVGSPRFIERWLELMEQIKNPLPVPSPATIAYLKNSIGWTIERYLAHDCYAKKLSPKTQQNYRYILDDLKRRLGGSMLADLTPRNLRVLRDQIAKEAATSTADDTIKVISRLWWFAGEHCDMDLGANPAREIAKVHDSEDYPPWPTHVIAKYFDGIPGKVEPVRAELRLATKLLFETGQRVGDVAAMKRDRFDGERIAVRQQKTDEFLWIPVVDPELLALLKAAPSNHDFLVSGYSGGPIKGPHL